MSGRVTASAIALCAIVTTVLSAQQPAQRTPVFRAGAVIVPLDLRVLDRAGHPVNDLKAHDIEILEDGVPQEIKHFSAVALAAEPDDLSRRLARRQPLGAETSPQSRRVFLIMLGRGRLQYPARGVDAMLHFVLERLLPQDLVAVFAYDRATAFTTDHFQIARTLERFRVQHETIEQLLRQRAGSLAAVYGNKDLPDSLRSKIDAIFPSAPAADSRELASAVVPHERRLNEDMGDPFDQFISANRQTMQDLGNLYTGIEYLRHIEGEKHLIFLTEQGLNLPRLEDETSLAAIAADARVAIDPIQTGGVIEPPPQQSSNVTIAPGSLSPSTPPPNSDAMWRQTLALMSMRTIAELTGGQASMLAYAEGAIDRINASTRFGYQLGYTPTNLVWDGRYRRIQIIVHRPDVTAFYRHGYYGREDLVGGDRKQFLITSRMNAAVGYRREIRDLRVKATAKESTGAAGAAGIDVSVNLDATRVRFETVQNQQVATLYIALVCLDTRQLIAGQSVEEYIVRYDDAGRAQALKDGITYTGHVTPQRLTATVKVVVYDYAADLLGTVVAAVR